MSFFRNLTFFRFPASLDTDNFQLKLDTVPLKPVGPLELSSRGFVSPFGRDSEELIQVIGDFAMITLGGEDRILPADVVNDLLAKKLAEIEKKEGRVPGGRTRKRIKEDLVHELLPRAFVKPSRVNAILDARRGFLVVDTSSRKVAESVVSAIRHALGSFQALPINAELAPRSVLTGWIAGEPMLDSLVIGEEAQLQDAADDGAVVKCQHQDLRGEEIAKHLEAGKQVTRLALVMDDHLSFVLGEDLVVRKLKFLDGAVDKLEKMDREDLRAELDARFALMSGEFKRLFRTLEVAFKLSSVQ